MLIINFTIADFVDTYRESIYMYTPVCGVRIYLYKIMFVCSVYYNIIFTASVTIYQTHSLRRVGYAAREKKIRIIILYYNTYMLVSVCATQRVYIWVRYHTHTHTHTYLYVYTRG